jgi:hypothetical protein
MNSQTERSRKPSARSCFSLASSKTLTAVAGAVGKVNIPLRLRDVQVQWESPAFRTFPRNGFFHGPCTQPMVQKALDTSKENP